MSKSLFLTGAKGFVGSHLLPRLIEEGYQVETDMRYLETNKWDTIVHLAATTHTRTEFDPNIYYNNFLLTHKIFNQNSRILYASSCSARHNTNPYASSKIWAEFLGEKHGDALGLRFHNIYGDGNSKGIVWFLQSQADGSKINIRGPELIRDYVHVSDVVNFILKQLGGWVVDLGKIRKYIEENPSDLKNVKYYIKSHQEVPGASNKIDSFRSGIVDVGTGKATTTKELVELYQELSGKRFDVTFVPADIGDPKEMVSNKAVPHIDLKTGLLKLIKHESVQIKTVNTSN